MFKQLTILGALLCASAVAKEKGDPYFKGTCRASGKAPATGNLSFSMKEDGSLLEEGDLQLLKAQVTGIPKNIGAISIDIYEKDPLTTRTPVSEGSLGKWLSNRRGMVRFTNSLRDDLSLKTLPAILESPKTPIDGMWIGVRDLSVADGLGLLNSCQISVELKGCHDCYDDDDVFPEPEEEERVRPFDP